MNVKGKRPNGLFFFFRVIYTLYYAKKETKTTNLYNTLEVFTMANMNNNVKVNTATADTGIRYRTPDGLIFYSREEYLDYVRGLRN